MRAPGLFPRWRSSSAQGSAAWPAWRLGLCLFLLVLWAFLPSLNNGFVGYDDPEYVTGNRHVQEGLTWDSIRWAFTSFDAANWHPLTWLSHQLDVELFGAHAWGHHLTNVCLHALNSTLLFLALRTLTGAVWRSLLVALLFGIHPLRVESVAWISERKDVLSATFFLLTLLTYAAYVKIRDATTGAPSRLTGDAKVDALPQYLVCLGVFCLGLMCKPMLVTLPFVLLLLDYWPLNRLRNNGTPAPLRGVLREKAPFFLAAGGAAVVTVLAQQRGGAIVENAPLSARIGNAVVSCVRYIGKQFWPVDLSCFYPPAAHWPAAIVAGSAALLAVLCLLVYIARERHPFLPVGWLWFLGMLMPVLGLVPVGEQAMADRYSYLPGIGLLLCFVWGGYELAGRIRAAGPILLAICVAAAAASAVLTRTQITCWRNTETLFAHALEVHPGNYLALNNLGTTLDKRGLFDEAIQKFNEALRYKPDYAQALNNLGVVLLKTGRREEAVARLRQALDVRPGYADAHNNLGLALEQQGKLDEAMEQFAEACRLRPTHADAHYNFGLQLMRKGQLPEAIHHFQLTLRLQPGSPDAHNNLGFAYQQFKQLAPAVAEYRQAIHLRPDYARAHFNLGVALFEQGQVDEAIAEFQTALQIKPDYVEAQKNLNTLLEARSRGRGSTPDGAEHRTETEPRKR